MGFDKLSEIFGALKTRYPNLGKRMQEAEAIEKWPAIVGPAIAKNARSVRVQDRVLWVEVDHPIWKSELHHRKHQILEALNQPLSPENRIRDILFIDPLPVRKR